MPLSPVLIAAGEFPLTSMPPGAVLDTNVALDWLLFDDPAVASLAAAVSAGHVRWLATVAMRDEMADVLRRGLAASRSADAPTLLAAWDAHCILHPWRRRSRCDAATPATRSSSISPSRPERAGWSAAIGPCSIWHGEPRRWGWPSCGPARWHLAP